MTATTERETFTITGEQRREIVRQIGTGNVLSISGGRVTALPDGIELPVSNGYRVRVRLAPNDTYTVERVLIRKGRVFPHGEKENIYCDEVGEQAYRAACFRSYSDGEW